MLFKNGDKEFQLDGRGDVFLGTLLIAGGTYLTRELINVFHTLAKRQDLPDVLEKSTKVINLEDFRTKFQNSKRKY